VQADEIHSKTDNEIAVLCLSNIDFFAVVIERYETKLAQYLRRKAILSKEDVEDLLQNIFTKVYVNLPAFRPELAFSAWIYRIAYNEVIDWYRKAKVRATVHLDNEDEGLLEVLASDLNVEKEVELKHDLKKLELAIESLDEKYREPLVLRFFEEKDYQEIGDILKIPIGTVSTLIARGKKQLVEKLNNK
jgi:RNA polymerase sigma-70 factor (ECF subfamily)